MTTFAPGAEVALPNGRWARVRFQVGRFVRVTLRPGVVRTLDVAQLSTREQVLAALRRREPAPPVPLARAPVGSLHRAMLDALASCTFLPASWDKRFVRDLQGAATLTPRQALNIERLAFRYRRQILGVDASRDINALPAEERAPGIRGLSRRPDRRALARHHGLRRRDRRRARRRDAAARRDRHHHHATVRGSLDGAARLHAAARDRGGAVGRLQPQVLRADPRRAAMTPAEEYAAMGKKLILRLEAGQRSDGGTDPGGELCRINTEGELSFAHAAYAFDDECGFSRDDARALRDFLNRAFSLGEWDIVTAIQAAVDKPVNTEREGAVMIETVRYILREGRAP